MLVRVSRSSWEASAPSSTIDYVYKPEHSFLGMILSRLLLQLGTPLAESERITLLDSKWVSVGEGTASSTSIFLEYGVASSDGTLATTANCKSFLRDDLQYQRDVNLYSCL